VRDGAAERRLFGRALGIDMDELVVVGGIGSQVELALRDAGLATPLDQLGIPKEFLEHGSRGQLLDRIGLTPDAVADRLRARLA